MAPARARSRSAQNKLAADCFVVVVAAIIGEFTLANADPKISKKLTLATMLPFTDGPAQADMLTQELLG